MSPTGKPRPTLAEVLDELAGAGLLAASADPSADQARHRLGARAGAALTGGETDDAPWFVHLFVVLGTWVGALFAGSFFVAVEVHELTAVSLFLGALMLAGAAALARIRRRTLFRVQLVWVLAIGAQVLVFGAIAEHWWSSAAALLACVLLLQVACVAAVPSQGLRVLCTAAAVAALAGLCRELAVPLGQELVVMALAVAVAAVWIHEPRVCASRAGTLWMPLAHAVPAGLLVAHLILAIQPTLDHAPRSAPWLAALGIAATGIWVMRAAAREQGEASGRTPVRLAIIGLVLVAALAYRVPGVTMALLLLALAHLRRSLALEIQALLHLALFLFLLYYLLPVGLLATSLCVLASGAVLLGCVVVLDRIGAVPRARARFRRGRRRELALAGAVLAVSLAVPAWGVLDKESTLRHGTTVLLDLRPRDPRSLMQGDYMTLRYAMEDDILARDPGPGPGTLIMALDSRGVARFVDLDGAGRPGSLGPGELRLRFRHVQDGFPPIRIGAESFFFEEGTAERYQRARYGELVVDEDGNTVLVGLRDADLQRIEP